MSDDAGRKAGDPLRRARLRQCVEDPAARLHFVGVAGSGMSALAEFRILEGGRVSGSDRAFDLGQMGAEAERLRRAGVLLHPQDGSGTEGAAAVIASTAVEAAIPDLMVARAREVPVFHRAELLAEHVRSRRSIAIAGTSGKSTVTAMVFEILSGAGADPALITGGDLRMLAARGRRGNTWWGAGPLVVEADESDGSLVEHEPALGVVLNLHRDHMEPEAALALFQRFARQCRDAVIVSDDPELASLREGALVQGFGEAATFRGTDLVLGSQGSRFRVRDVEVVLPVPGAHNARNALAALAVAERQGVAIGAAAAALRRYQGVARRFEVLGRRGGIEVIDDFAHNPAKIAATLEAAKERGGRVHAFFQPHGFAPTRFLRDDLVQAFARGLRPEDTAWLGEIYYAGGTVARSLSSADLVADLCERGVAAVFLGDRTQLGERLRPVLRAGDVILVMGARDPTLPEFARELLSSLPDATVSI